MKKIKISKILGVGLSLAMLVSLIGVATPASAATLSISSESSVDDLKDRVNYILGPANVDIVDLAVNGKTMYAATGTTTTDNTTFKSTDGGATWSKISTKTDLVGDVEKAVMLVAVASDDADVVAIVSSEPEVYFSSDGGSSWDDMNILSTVSSISAIDVSEGPTNYVAIAGTRTTYSATTLGTAELWTRKLAMAADWAAESEEGNNFTDNQTSVKAVKFSPNFQTDETITIISANTSATTAFFQVFRYTTGQQAWNQGITREGMEDYGIGILIDPDTGISGGLAAADIALVSTYLGTEETERIAFVAVAGATAGGGVFRLSDSSSPKQFETWSDGEVDPCGSLAYNDDSGILLGGVYNGHKAYTWLEPMSGTSPNAERPNTLKPPSGLNRTVVAWSGDTAVAATSGAESAFAVSTDNGYAWNDISMVDTVLSVLDDVALNADGSKIYMTSHTGVYASVWLNAGTWKRVFSRTAADANKSSYLVRVAPGSDGEVYVSSNGTTDLWVSKDSGIGTWKANPVAKISYIQDFVVASADVLYAIDNNGATKSINAGASWSDEVDLDGVAGYMITLAPNGDVLVGGSNRYVAFSKDAGASFTRISDTTAATVYVVADKDYATNNTIYVASGAVVERGKADKNEDWSERGALDATHTARGIVRYDTVIYVLSTNATDSKLYRALNLLKADTTDLADWSYRLKTSVKTPAGPQPLKISTDAKTKSPKFWLIDSDSSMALNSIVDPIATVGPTLTGPKDASTIKVNTLSGAAYDVSFTWGRYASKYILSMDIQISTDKTFSAKIKDGTVYNIDTDAVAAVFGPGAAAPYNASFMPGTTYYWRVRHSKNITSTQTDADRNFLSPWSKVQSFTVEDIALASFVISSPASGSYDVPVNPLLTWGKYPAAIGYELMVAEDPTFAIIDFSYNVANNLYKVNDTLKNSTTYYWRVRGVTGEAALVKSALVVPAGPWVTGVFTTEAVPAEPTPPVVITQPTAPEVKIVEVPIVQQAPVSAPLLWAIVVIGAVLVIALIVLIVRTRRVA